MSSGKMSGGDIRARCLLTFMFFVSEGGVLTAWNNCKMSKSCYSSHPMHITIDVSCWCIIYEMQNWSSSSNRYELYYSGMHIIWSKYQELQYFRRSRRVRFFLNSCSQHKMYGECQWVFFYVCEGTFCKWKYGDCSSLSIMWEFFISCQILSLASLFLTSPLMWLLQSIWVLSLV